MLRRIPAFILSTVLALFLVGSTLNSNAALITTPATISNVSYQYSDRVKFIDFSDADMVDGSVRITGTSLSAGDILVDREKQKTMKIMKVNADGSYIVGQPTMIEIFSDFKIPRQVIEPTPANIIEYEVKGISVKEYAAKLAGQTGQTQTLMSGNAPSAQMKDMYNLFNSRGSKIYEYSGEYTFRTYDVFKPLTMTLELDGAVGVSPGIVAEYSFSDGYEFGFVDAAQFIDLNALINVKIDKELYFPIFSVIVGIEGLGSVKLGIFLVIDIDGDIALTVRAQEGVKATASVYGSTKWGIPTSFHVNNDVDKFFGAECDPMGYIHAGFYVTPLVGLEILSIDVFNAQLRVGFYAYADIAENTMSYGVDFVVNAFVTILDDRTNLINLHIPIIERNKSFRAEDDVIYYFSRLCTYQDRINIAAMTKRLAGTTPANAVPFSDKLPFSNRNLEIWYYASGNDPQGGANQNPTRKVTVKTDDQGCVGLDFSIFNIDVGKGDCIIIKAPGFYGQSDIINGVTPFLGARKPGDTDYYGTSKLRGDFFEDTVQFTTLSGRDLTVLDVPNSEVRFETQDRIYYEGPVTVYSTDVATKVTEKATFTADRYTTEYKLRKTGAYVSVLDADYNIKPNCELRWQINQNGYIFGTYEPTGAGGHKTEHNVVVRRVMMDQQVPIEDLEGNIIGLQHNVTLSVIAVNKGGSRPYTGTAQMSVELGEVPADFVQGDLPIQDLGYIRFPAANMRYPNHFEYYPENPFPITLYETDDIGELKLGSPVSSPEGTSTEAVYRWRWEEIKPDIAPTVTITQKYTAPTGQVTWITQEVPNILYYKPPGVNIDAFAGMEILYTVTDPDAGVGYIIEEDDSEEDGDFTMRNRYEMRHIVSGMQVEGVDIPNPPFSPPPPIIYVKQGIEMDANAFNIEFQLQHMRDVSQYVVNPLDRFEEYSYASEASVIRNTAVAKPPVINNKNQLPAWARGYISAVVNNGIMELDSKGSFAAGQYTTRAQFCAAIVNALGLTELDAVKSGFPFTDVSANNPYLKQMQTAYQCGIINGISSTAFSPDTLITRQDAAAMLMRAFNLRNAELIPESSEGALVGFSDRRNVSGYAVKDLESAVSLGFFNGYSDGTIMPRNNINNEQTAKILWELKLKAEKPGLQYG